MNYNSRKSNFYDSHAQREMTLAYSENTTVAVKMRGDWHTETSYPCVRANWSGSKYQCWGGDVQQSQEQESDSISARNLGLASESPV